MNGPLLPLAALRATAAGRNRLGRMLDGYPVRIATANDGRDLAPILYVPKSFEDYWPEDDDIGVV